MKTYNERTKSIIEKAEKREAAARKRKRQITITCCSLAFVMIVSAVLFTPADLFQKKQTDKDYSDHRYAAVINSLRPLTVTPNSSGSNNLFDRLFGSTAKDESANLGGMVPEMAPVPPMASPDSDGVTNSSPSYGNYEEITDNQVDGVTEGDLIKRSDRYIYYLRDGVLYIYSIEGEASKLVGQHALLYGSNVSINYYSNQQMYLSEDCSTITVITGCYFKKDNSANVAVINLRVSDPENIEECAARYVSGSYLTSRMVDGELYLMTRFYVPNNPDFDDLTTYIPHQGSPLSMKPVPMGDISIPENPTSAMYTVIHHLSEYSLDVYNSSALLSYTGTVYMSQENIYLTRNYVDTEVADGKTISENMTEITRLDYDLNVQDTYQIKGHVNNQYSLDENDGFLRVVTTTGSSILHETSAGETTSAYYERIPSNASLYCIFLGNGDIWGSVENFAPEGESVQSVRFDGDNAYVCTSLVLQDPVFFFDLSDVDNITYKDTGTIPGYSMSLVDFAEGFLLGIGYGDSTSTLKIEIYREGEDIIESHCKYERTSCSFSDEYKSYYIDRENQFIGLGLKDYNDKISRYILLFFDGYELITVSDEELPGIDEYKRAVYIDGYLYMFGNDFLVKPI